MIFEILGFFLLVSYGENRGNSKTLQKLCTSNCKASKTLAGRLKPKTINFRPDYCELKQLRQSYPGVPFMALTATATPRVRADVVKQLGMSNSKWFLTSFNRNNLQYEVRTKKGKGSCLNDIIALIKSQFQKKSGIVYCFSRKECEDVATELKKNGISAVPYHAGLGGTQRTLMQEQWIKDRAHVVCATIAFGMGIDKPDVRFVIHYALPKSMEGYYQESGRAGRDGRKSTCVLL